MKGLRLRYSAVNWKRLSLSSFRRGKALFLWTDSDLKVSACNFATFMFFLVLVRTIYTQKSLGQRKPSEPSFPHSLHCHCRVHLLYVEKREEVKKSSKSWRWAFASKGNFVAFSEAPRWHSGVFSWCLRGMTREVCHLFLWRHSGGVSSKLGWQSLSTTAMQFM